jgi:predicted TIM-barrel fold metal-dependent hydrolase
VIPGGVVDAHLHLWYLARFRYPWLADDGNEELRYDYLTADWRADAREVDVAATVHIQAELDHARDPVEETAWLASLDGPAPTVCIGYADLRAPDLGDVLDRHQEHALFRGIRHLAWYDPHSAKADVPRHNPLDDPSWLRGLDHLAARGLSFDLQVWPHQLAQAASIFRDRSELPVVLEHTGLPFGPDLARWRTELRRFAAQVPHALLKISALRSIFPTWPAREIAPVVHEAIAAFGPDRCMFGSNFPVDKTATGYGELWRTYDALIAEFSANERTRMLRTNAARFYRISL